MAIGWISLLKTVPWSDVISSAPTMAEGAKKLWRTVAKKSPPTAASPQATAALVPEVDTLAQAQARLATLEHTVAELHQQMLASSELIKALADQNTELVQRAEANRLRLRWLSASVLVAVALAAISLALVLTYP